MKRIWNNICHPPSSIIGVGILVLAGAAWWVGKTDATGFTIAAGIALPLITMVGKKKAE